MMIYRPSYLLDDGLLSGYCSKLRELLGLRDVPPSIWFPAVQAATNGAYNAVRVTWDKDDWVAEL